MMRELKKRVWDETYDKCYQAAEVLQMTNTRGKKPSSGNSRIPCTVYGEDAAMKHL